MSGSPGSDRVEERAGLGRADAVVQAQDPEPGAHIAARIRHHAKAAIFAASLHNGNESSYTFCTCERQMVKFFDFGKRNIHLRAAGKPGVRKSTEATGGEFADQIPDPHMARASQFLRLPDWRRNRPRR